jgi:hypothetical protein
MYSIHRIHEETYLGGLGHMEKDEAEVHLILENEEWRPNQFWGMNKTEVQSIVHNEKA